MEDELEIIGAASAGAVARDLNGDGFLQGPCPNCGTELQGEYCWSCGQSAKDMKRPFWSLFMDILNAIFAFDGRLALTMPALMFRPGKMTRNYIDGQRVRYVPPFRLFLIASVLFFLTLFSIGERQSWMKGDDVTLNSTQSAISEMIVDGRPLREFEGYESVFDADGKLDRAAAEAFLNKLQADGTIEPDQDVSALMGVLDGVNTLTLSRREIFATVQKWAPRLSLLLLPFTILSLTILHIWIRRIYIYDHVIVALHLQTFIYLAATLAIWFSYVSAGWAWTIFGIGVPVYTFFLLGRSYDTHWFLNLNRMIGLAISTSVALLIFVIAMSAISAKEIGLFDLDEPPVNLSVEE